MTAPTVIAVAPGAVTSPPGSDSLDSTTAVLAAAATDATAAAATATAVSQQAATDASIAESQTQMLLRDVSSLREMLDNLTTRISAAETAIEQLTETPDLPDVESVAVPPAPVATIPPKPVRNGLLRAMFG